MPPQIAAAVGATGGAELAGYVTIRSVSAMAMLRRLCPIRTVNNWELLKSRRSATSSGAAVYDSEAWMGSEIEDNDAPSEECIPQEALSPVLGAVGVRLYGSRSH